MKRSTMLAAAIAGLTLAGGASAATCSSLDPTATTYSNFGSCTGSGNDFFLPPKKFTTGESLRDIVNRLFGDEGIAVTGMGSFTPGRNSGREFGSGNPGRDGFSSTGFNSSTITFSSLPADTIFVSIKQGNGFELFPVLSSVPFSLTHSLAGGRTSHVSTLAGTGTPPIGGNTNVIPLPAAVWLLMAGIGGLAAVGRRRRPA